MGTYIATPLTYPVMRCSLMRLFGDDMFKLTATELSEKLLKLYSATIIHKTILSFCLTTMALLTKLASSLAMEWIKST